LIDKLDETQNDAQTVAMRKLPIFTRTQSTALFTAVIKEGCKEPSGMLKNEAKHMNKTHY
jgi:hypothetical protein